MEIANQETSTGRNVGRNVLCAHAQSKAISNLRVLVPFVYPAHDPTFFGNSPRQFCLVSESQCLRLEFAWEIVHLAGVRSGDGLRNRA